MDPQKMKEAYERLRLLDERYAGRFSRHGGGSLMRPGLEQLEDHLRHLTHYTVELRDIVEELFLALATRPGGPAPPPSQDV